MKFESLPLEGLRLIHLDPRGDERGAFARTFCSTLFAEAGLETNYPQCNLSWNERMGTLRGMHFQTAPHEEAKIVRVTRGRIFDVVVDVRPASSTYLQWYGVRLSEGMEPMLYIPAGFAHGFQTLVDGVEVAYWMSTPYSHSHQAALRWDDPVLDIDWPLSGPILSERDRTHPLLADRDDLPPRRSNP